MIALGDVQWDFHDLNDKYPMLTKKPFAKDKKYNIYMPDELFNAENGEVVRWEEGRKRRTNR